MPDLLHGLAIGLGIIGGLVLGLAALLAVVLLASLAWTRRSAPGRGAVLSNSTPAKLETLSNDDLRQRIQHTANELDLWLRAASLRDIEVSVTLARMDPDEIYTRGRYRISAKI